MDAMAPELPALQSRVLADTSSSGISSDACAGADVEEETGSVDEQATRKEDVTNALTLRKIGSLIFPDYVDPAYLPVSHTVRLPPDMMQINSRDGVEGRFD